MSDLTNERLKELLEYKPGDGVFVRRCTAGGQVKGSVAGSINSAGYRLISVDGSLYVSSRLAFFYMTGSWPKEVIDHINGNRDDDRWSNLREATLSQNAINSKVSTRNTSGVVGVGWSKRNRKWIAHIRINKKHKQLGYYKTKQEAIEARKQAEKEHYGDYAPREKETV